MSARRSSAAAECSTGMEALCRALVMMTASLSVQSPLWHRGRMRPCRV